MADGLGGDAHHLHVQTGKRKVRGGAKVAYCGAGLQMTIKNLPEVPVENLIGGCPHLALARARREAPLARISTPFTGGEVLMVSRNKNVLRVADDAEHFVSSGHVQARRFGSGYSKESDLIYENEGWPLRPALVWTDGEQHARVRRLVDKVFTPVKVNRRISLIQGFIAELLAEFPAEGQVEYASAYSFRLPTMIITHELGLGQEHLPLVKRATDTVSFANDLASPREAAVPAAKAVTELQRVLAERIVVFRENPSENLLSDLVHAKLDDTLVLSPDELMSTAILLLLAGSHTTSVMLTWALFMLASRQDIQTRLRSDRGRISNFVEELLRVHGTVSAGYRLAAADTEVAGSTVPKGTCVMIRWDSANRDESVFERPDEFDIDRPNLWRHTAFGHGKHYCIGNGLARAELRETVGAMLDRFNRIDLVDAPSTILPAGALDNHALTRLNLDLRTAS